MRTRYQNFVQYSADDWRVMQSAHDLASNVLGRSPKTDIHAQRLGRTVIALFGLKLRNVEEIADRAARSERRFDAVASLSSITPRTRQTG
ncbi:MULTISPECIES: hypothetical protein [Phyllobacterium]|jgi:hypothetical protein|uniref:hypothetical protein n=1 Tax=Phyllobacterium TaxID=28100 RepID=UPI001CBFF118|nr:hypothetical protein [Phyllobacterium calauticae]MBZ3695457.1 hypothetical protein [Phyllobacterium calauticae]